MNPMRLTEAPHTDAPPEALEQQLGERIRRRALLDPSKRTSRGVRRIGTNMLTIASLMLLSLMLGATGTFAVVYQDLAPQRELHLQKAAILLERAQVRLEQLHADLAELLPLVEQGLAGDIVAARFRNKVSRAESEVQCRELDLKETRITGRAPVDDLAGPLVDGEDFIAQRLEAQHEAVGPELQQVQAEFSRTKLLAERGVVSERELIRGRADLEEAEQTLARLQERINLRRSFISGDMAAEEVELRALLRDTEAEHTVAEARLSAAQTRLQQVATLHKRGALTTGRLREAQAEVRDAESNLALAEVQLKMIRQRLEAFEQQD
jgi:multidrug resistance efflux pump